MKRMVVIIIAGVLLIAATWFLLEYPSDDGSTTFEGRNARQWLEEVYTTNQQQATTAFQTIGTNAFPVLLKVLASNGTPREKLHRWVYSRLPFSWQMRWKRPPNQDELWNAAQWELLTSDKRHQALPELARIFANKRCPSRLSVIYLISACVGEADTQYIPLLTDTLGDRDPNIRHSAIQALANIGPPAKTAVPALTGLLHNTNLDNRVEAAMAVRRINGYTNTAVTVIQEVMNSSGPSSAKDMAPFHLLQIHPQDESLIPLLISRLGSKDDGVVVSAAGFLPEYGPKAKQAIPALLKLTNSPSLAVRFNALSALKRIDPENADSYETK